MPPSVPMSLCLTSLSNSSPTSSSLLVSDCVCLFLFVSCLYHLTSLIINIINIIITVGAIFKRGVRVVQAVSGNAAKQSQSVTSRLLDASAYCLFYNNAQSNVFECLTACSDRMCLVLSLYLLIVCIDWVCGRCVVKYDLVMWPPPVSSGVLTFFVVHVILSFLFSW